MKQRQNRRKTDVAAQNGFTLIEILIVVIILGILASIIIPQFSNASEQARENILRETLRNLRTQINVYRAQHNDISPGYPNGDPTETPTWDDFREQMTEQTDIYGNISASVTPYGPYLRSIPENPLNHLSEIDILADADALPGSGDDSHGWTFRPGDVVFLSDNAGTDGAGDEYYNY